MEVYALIGASGTGKSHRALLVAHEHSIDMIIDDGLLIKESRILAGISAKRSPTRVGAIKTALFSEESHRQEVFNKIKEYNPERILVLGTSKEMAEKITRRLDIPLPSNFLQIEDIASPKEIRKAMQERNNHGTHVVPAPTVEVKQRFSGSLIAPLRTIFQKKANQVKNVPPRSQLWVEQSVVRPTFNYLGKFYIANNVVTEIVNHVCQEVEGINKVTGVTVDTQDNGARLHVDISVIHGYSIPEIVIKAQKIIRFHVEKMTSLNILTVDVHVKKMIVMS